MDQWKKLLIYTALIAYLYVFMEWAFFITKPSFLDGMSFYENMTVFFVSGGMAALIFAMPVVLLMGAGLLLKHHEPSKIFYFAVISPALLLGALMLILFDNFTYTVFKFGIVTSTGNWRGIYGLFFLYLIWVSSQWILQSIRTTILPKFLQYLPLGLIAISSLLAGEQFINHRLPDISESTSTLNNRPHILLIGSDGINSVNMSAYDYERATTPFLNELAASTLFAENAFANWTRSAASTTSMLTGKHPLETQVYSSEDILIGINSFQHLPGILRNHGYFSVQLGVLSYVDAYSVNLQDAFDVANGRVTDQSPIVQTARKLGQGNSTYFVVRIFERISSRLMHIYYLREMTNPFAQVTISGENIALNDQEKIEEVIRLFDNADQPLFIHVHLMGTHGPLFSPPEQTFSTGKEQSREWLIDFYDDSILVFDSYMEKVFEALVNSGQLENTIVIIHSDHGMAKADQRVPLMFRFPNSEFAGRISANVQNLDIAPTVLDYLGIPIPSWMDGISLLQGEPPMERLLILGENPETRRVIQCERLYKFRINAQVVLRREIKGHTTQCSDILTKTNDIPQDVLDYFVNINDLDDHAAMSLTVNDIPQIFFDYISLDPSDENSDSLLDVTSRMTSRESLVNLMFLYMSIKQENIPPAQGIFSDMQIGYPNAPELEYAYQLGLLDPCESSPLSLCPQGHITRQETAKIILRGILGSDYIPLPAEGIFEDVSQSSSYAPWVEELYRRGISVGCSSSPLRYCPETLLTTTQMLILLERAFFDS